MDKLTDKPYWEETYSHRKRAESLRIDGFKNFMNSVILAKLLETGVEGKKVLEIGAGDSIWLPYLAKKFPSSRFVGVDYTESGCALLSHRAKSEGADVEVVREDLFSEDSNLHDSFDIVCSFGVVEHFEDLGNVLSAKKRYLKHGGVMFTLIPNMAGVSGALTRRWNRTVYDKHNPHDLPSLLAGHEQAGLKVISGGYLGSLNFGVLTGCFADRRGLSWQMSRALIALSMSVWLFESKIVQLPASKTFSPYIYVISQKA